MISSNITKELFQDDEKALALARSTCGMLGVFHRSDFLTLNEAVNGEHWNLTYLATDADEHVGYVKMRPTSDKAMHALDTGRADNILSRHAWMPAMRAYHIARATKRNRIAQRLRVLDFLIDRSRRDDAPIHDLHLFRVWVEEIGSYSTGKRRFTDEELITIMELIPKIKDILVREGPSSKTGRVQKTTEE